MSSKREQSSQSCVQVYGLRRTIELKPTSSQNPYSTMIRQSMLVSFLCFRVTYYAWICMELLDEPRALTSGLTV